MWYQVEEVVIMVGMKWRQGEFHHKKLRKLVKMISVILKVLEYCEELRKGGALYAEVMRV
jgi:hypothetical protein